MRGGLEGSHMDLVNGDETFPPHPGPLPLGGGEGECFAVPSGERVKWPAYFLVWVKSTSFMVIFWMS